MREGTKKEMINSEEEYNNLKEKKNRLEEQILDEQTRVNNLKKQGNEFYHEKRFLKVRFLQ